jgi:hypothetical protein
MKYIIKNGNYRTDIPSWKQCVDILSNVNDLIHSSTEDDMDDEFELGKSIIHHLSLVMEKIEQEHPTIFDDETF